MANGRDLNGRFAKGNPGNPGGITHRQKAMVAMLEGLSEKAIRVLDEAMDGPDRKLAVDAAKEVVKRIAPKQSSAASVNVAIQNNMPNGPGSDPRNQEVWLRATLRARGIDPTSVLGPPQTGPAAALAAPAAPQPISDADFALVPSDDDRRDDD
jgi:hypothetical protein